MIVERGVAARDGFETVVKIEHDFSQGQLIRKHDAGGAYIFEALLAAAFFFHQFQNAADIFFVGDDGGHYDRLFGLGDLADRRPAGGIVNLHCLAISLGDAEADSGSGGYEVQAEFALQTLLDDLHVQQTKKTTAKAEAQSHRRFRLKEK